LLIFAIILLMPPLRHYYFHINIFISMPLLLSPLHTLPLRRLFSLLRHFIIHYYCITHYFISRLAIIIAIIID
jgi:hypothetical protein